MVAFIGPKDIPKGGSNSILMGSANAPIFAKDKVEYMSQPLGIIVATTPAVAAQAAPLVAVLYGHPKVSAFSIHAESCSQSSSSCNVASCTLIGVGRLVDACAHLRVHLSGPHACML